MIESTREPSAARVAPPDEELASRPSLVRLAPAARALGLAAGELRARAASRGVQLHRVERGGELEWALDLADLRRLAEPVGNDDAKDGAGEAAAAAARAEQDREREREARRAAEFDAAESERRSTELADALRAARADEEAARAKTRAARSEASLLAAELEQERKEAGELEDRAVDLASQAEALERAWDDERRARLALASAGEGDARRIAALEAEVRAGLDRDQDQCEELERRARELSSIEAASHALGTRVEELETELELERTRSRELATRLGYVRSEVDQGEAGQGEACAERVERRLAEIARGLDATRRALSREE